MDSETLGKFAGALVQGQQEPAEETKKERRAGPGR
jgi:hypothetical protein